jgi:hypothetical protein
MRLRAAFGLTLATLVTVLTGGLSAIAQPMGGPPAYIFVDPRQVGRSGYPPRPPPPVQRRDLPGYYPGMLVQPAPQPGFSLRRLFGIGEPPPQPLPYEAPRVRPARPRPAPPASVVRQERPKVDPSTHVVVFGDSLAELTGQGLDDVFEQRPDIAVIRKVRRESGLVRNDVLDWPKYIKEVLDGGQKITLAAILLGANDRQQLKEGDVTHEPLSEGWKALYRQRVDSVARVFQERGIPVVWIGVPPMKNDKLSADYMAMNEIFRESVQRFGGSYVDIWPGFVDDENRYTATGPDVDGQPSRLRSNDGVHFTKAGARKAAHFADAEIRRIIEAKRTGSAVVSVPSADGGPDENASIEQVINASVPPPPEPSGTPPLQAKPLAGPVLPLTRPELSPGGTLVSGRPRLDSDVVYPIRKALREGVAPSPRDGRADDFRWPRE